MTYASLGEIKTLSMPMLKFLWPPRLGRPKTRFPRQAPDKEKTSSSEELEVFSWLPLVDEVRTFSLDLSHQSMHL